jgi:hypothetical protein
MHWIRALHTMTMGLRELWTNFPQENKVEIHEYTQIVEFV